MTKEDYKHIIISICIGAFMAFFSTLFQGLADFIKTHNTDIISGAATAFSYIALGKKA